MSYLLNDQLKFECLRRRIRRCGDISQRVALRTLDLPFFKEFEVGYREEWETLLASNGKHKNSEAASIK